MAAHTRKQLRSANYVNSLLAIRNELGDHPRDPLWWEYNGKLVRIVFTLNMARGNGSRLIDVVTMRGDSHRLLDDEIFKLIPKGYMRQSERDDRKVDVFDLPLELNSLYARIQRMITRNRERWGIEDGGAL